MKKIFIMFLLFACSVLQAQYVIESFDSAAVNNHFEANVEGAPSNIIFTDNYTDFKEGTGALDVKYVIGAFHPWGSYGNAIYRLPDGADPMDWSINDTLSIWIKVRKAPTHPEYMVFRIHIADRPTSDVDMEEYIYENTTIFDTEAGWVELKVPFIERETDGSITPNEEGFVLFPSSWGGGTYNNRKLDLDKIVQFNISAVTTGWTDPENIPADSVEITFDKFARIGARSIPFIIFNGKTLTSSITNTWAWGQSSIAIEENAGPVAGSNALVWVQGDEWSNGWTGFGFDIDPAFNMTGVWLRDSLKFKMKAEEGVGQMRAQFESSAGKSGILFDPIADNQWHQYSLSLKDFSFRDNAPAADSSQIVKFGIMAQATAVTGKKIYISDLWTGNPTLDVISPAAVATVDVIAGQYVNMVTWNDVSGESGEVYNVYYSQSPITDVTAQGVEVVKLSVVEGTQFAEHVLRAPNTDQNLTYYYAVVCRDNAGNFSDVTATVNSVTNLAKGVVTISMQPPTNFTADGDLAEWSGITPMRMFKSDASGTVVTNTTIDNDEDLSALAYVAVDNDNLYIAFDINDDVVFVDTTGTDYLQDCPDLFIGLYDWHGPSHTSYKRGAEPDYHFRFSQNRAGFDHNKTASNQRIVFTPGANYIWQEKFPSGYVVEAKIPFVVIAETMVDLGDQLFVPVEGMRIPIDFTINDNDGDAAKQREGMMTLSPTNQDLSYGNVSLWTYTWIGNKMTDVNPENNLPNSYSLSQNYPNPFNPTTQIQYTIEKPGNVSLIVYDILGRKVAELVNGFQQSGKYTVSFDASKLATGVYVYKIESGSYSSIKKMMLMK